MFHLTNPFMDLNPSERYIANFGLYVNEYCRTKCHVWSQTSLYQLRLVDFKQASTSKIALSNFSVIPPSAALDLSAPK